MSLSRQGLRPGEWRLQWRVDMEEVQSGGSGSVRLSPEHTVSTLVFPHASKSLGTGCHGAGLANTTPVRIFPDWLPHSSSGGHYGEKPILSMFPSWI